LTDLDIVSDIGIVQVKSGGGKGALAQAMNTDDLVDLPVAVFDANRIMGRRKAMKSSVANALREAGFEPTDDVDTLIEILRSGGRK
jgi:hypothetical protein